MILLFSILELKWRIAISN